METFKANFLILLFFGITIWLGYWSVTSILSKPSEEFVGDSQYVGPIVTTEPVGSDSSSSNNRNPIASGSTTSETSTNSNNEVSGSQSNLKNELQKLISDNVLMKAGSRGARVGVVQEFLNLYTNSNSKVDNDYGPGTETKVRNFQKENNLTADGQTGPNTYRKMIEWLDKQ